MAAGLDLALVYCLCRSDGTIGSEAKVYAAKEYRHRWRRSFFTRVRMTVNTIWH